MPIFIPNQPYNELPPLPPSQDVETKDILKKCISARAALATLKATSDLIPNPSMLINTIPLLEAKASSAIENIVTTTDRLFQFAEDSHLADAATKEALRYRTALYNGFQGLKDRPLSTGTAVLICSTISDSSIDIRKVPGVKLANNTTGAVIYTPPEGETRLRELLSNWEKYLHNEKNIDPLIRMSVAHYQFEAIHPFTDGNGRTGRILNLLYLVQEGLLSLPILYLSRYIIQHKAEYYDQLLKVTSQRAWEPWVMYMLNAVEETAIWTQQKIAKIKQAMLEVAEKVRQEHPAIYSRELIDIIFTQPYCRIHNLVDGGLGHRQTASTYLRQLSSTNILKEIKVGKEKLFINSLLLGILSQD